PNRFEGPESRMQSKESIEIDGGLVAAVLRLGYCNLGTNAGVAPIAKRHYRGHPVHRTTLKDRNDDRVILTRRRSGLGKSHSLQKRRCRGKACECDASRFNKESSRYRHDRISVLQT